MIYQTKTVGDTVFFYFASNNTTGSGDDGATPLFDVRLSGAAGSAAPIISGTPTLLTNAAFPAGCHEVAVVATIGNGFAADDTFAVFCTIAADSQNPSGFVGSCTLTPLAKQATLTDVETDVANVAAAQLDAQATRDTMKLAPTAGSPASGSIDDDLFIIRGDVDDIGNQGVGLTDLGGMSGGMTVEVTAACAIALQDINLDHLMSLAANGASVADNSAIAQIVSKAATADFDTYDNTTDSLEAIRDRGDSAWITGGGSSPTVQQIVDGVWDELKSAHNTADTFGDYLDTEVSGVGGGANPVLLARTQIATLSSSTDFTISSGSFDDDAFNNMMVVITDDLTGNDKAIGIIENYTGSNKRIQLFSAPESTLIYGVGDPIDVVAISPDIAATLAETEAITQTASLGLDNPILLTRTAISTLTSQTIFRIAAGSFDDDAYVGMVAVITDNLTGNSKAIGVVESYVGSTKQVTLKSDPGVFTMAVDDPIDIVAVSPEISEILVDTDTTIPAQISAILTTQMAESYAADGVEPTAAQAMYLIQQVLTDFVITGTTNTIREIDGTTTAATMTLNDGTDPTGTTRST